MECFCIAVLICVHIFCHWFFVSLSSITECKKTTPKLGKTMQYLSIIPIAIKDYKSNDEYVVYLKQMYVNCNSLELAIYIVPLIFWISCRCIYLECECYYCFTWNHINTFGSVMFLIFIFIMNRKFKFSMLFTQ